METKVIPPRPRNVNDRRPVDTTTPLATETREPADAAATKPQRPITMVISAVLNGFTVQVSFDGSMGQLPGAIERLKALGATPTASVPTAPLAAADDLPDGWKLCKKHGAPMRPRNKQGDTWNSHNVGTEDAPCWCKGY